MARARRKPHAPEVWTDTGPDTPAQRAGAVYRQARGGKRGEIMKERETPLDALLRKGSIDQTQHNAGLAALALYEATQRGPGWLKEAVDGTPDPGIRVVKDIEAQFAYARAVHAVPVRCLHVYRWVVEGGRGLETMRGCRNQQGAEYRHKLKLLRWALDSLRV